MALHRGYGAVPEGAVKVTEREAIERQWETIKNWIPKRDVWPFSYGVGILSISSAFSAIYINNHYRSMLHLQNYGRFATYLPIVMMPTVLSAFIHQEVITNDIIIERTPCPVCVQMRAAGIQTFMSTIFPTVLAPLSGLMFATRHYTYSVPPINRPAENLKLFKKLTRPIGNTLIMLLAFQAILGMAVTYLEADSYYNIKLKLLENEKDYQRRVTMRE